MWNIENAFEIKRPATYNNLVYRYRLLCQNFMVTENQKSTTEKHMYKKKQSKHNTKDNHQIKREEKKRGREEKRPTKSNPKQLTKWQ